ncbi:MAG: type III-B CRISPR module RAMP protein Cmr6 [Gammaproteobacteria bacterium]
MRSQLVNALGKNARPASAHPGLVYERYAPLVYVKPDEKAPDIGKVAPKAQEELLHEVSNIPVSPAYRAAWRRWYAALEQSGAVTRQVEATGRLLIGHGNPAPTEVGLTLHHVYGVPVLPGTALKGLLNHYLASWGKHVDLGWKGVKYDEKGRPVGAPGAYHGALFGVPNLPLGEGREQEGRSGRLVFEDAWLIPGDDDRPLCADVLTPHQEDYYRNFGAEPPNDWTDPNPVTFLTVKPKTRFLLAISPLDPDPKGADLAMSHLLDVLDRWGIGAKSRAGYGRLRRVDTSLENKTKTTARPPVAAPASAPASPALQALEEAVAYVADPPNRDEAPPIARRLDERVTDGLLEKLNPDEHARARQILDELTKHAGLRKRRQQRLDEIMNRVTK